MRVISGEFGGRLIRGPRGDATRPITDRVKTNLFNILALRIEGAVVADCFCGTGSLGIEALSRGAALAVFAEIDASALHLLRENIDELGLGERARIVRHDVLRRGLPCNAECGMRNAESTSTRGEPESQGKPFIPNSEFRIPNCYSLVFLDPPYRITETAGERLWLKLDEAASGGLLSPDAVVVWRHDSRIELAVPGEFASRLRIADVRSYGSQTLTFIGRA
jgi:16S rRNA G966 N2-methylase RsmD